MMDVIRFKPINLFDGFAAKAHTNDGKTKQADSVMCNNAQKRIHLLNIILRLPKRQ